MSNCVSKKPIVLQLITQAEFGGAQKYIFELATGLREYYTFIVGAGELDKSIELLIRLKNENIYTLKLTQVVRQISLLQDIRGIIQLIHCIIKIKPDIIHLHTSKMSILGSIAAKLSKILLLLRRTRYCPKIIYTAHGWVFREQIGTLRKQFYIIAERLTSRFKDVIITLSKSDRALALTLKIGSVKKITIIPNGISLNHKEIIEQRDARIDIMRAASKYNAVPRASIKELWIGTVANLYENKGLDVLIRAMKEVNTTLTSTNFDAVARAFIIGEGHLEQKLRHLIREQQLEDFVLLCGSLKDAWRYLRAFDIFALPSHKEGFPFALLEAMAAGLPVIATEVGAIPEILISGEQGFLVKPGDYLTLAQHIIELIHHEEKRKKIGIAGKHLVENKFTRQNLLDNVHDVYKKLVNN